MINKFYSERIYLFLLGLTAFTIPFDVRLNNLAIGLLILYWLFSGNLPGKLQSAFTNKYFWLFAAVYLIQFVGLLYSDDRHDALTKLEKRAGLLLLPLIILSSHRLSGRQLFYVITSFIGACFLLFIIALYKVIAVHGTLLNVPHVTEFIDDFIHLHHAYSGMYLVFAIISSVYYLTHYWHHLKLLYKISASLVVLILYFFLLVLGARMALFISFLVLGLQIILFIIKKRSGKTLAFTLLIVLIGITGVLSLPGTRKKLHEFVYLQGVYHPFTPRLIQWECCFDILSENNAWIGGVGTGDVKPKLQACYQEKKFWGHLYNYNAHNEYLEEMIRHGFMGLSILLISLFYPLWFSFKHKHYLYTFFLIIFIFVCISESVLNRQKGVIFYSFFNALLVMPLIASRTPKDG